VTPASGLPVPAIAAALDAAAVPGDAVLVVHSAIRGLSQQGFRAEAIIETLLQRLPEGTLLMPTMTWRTVTPHQPVFDELLTPSHTGVLTEVFRTRYATARSLHPTHSVAGCGPLASLLLSSHHLGGTPVPASSPYGLMRDWPSYVLMLGVGLECATVIHHPEEVLAPETYLRPATEAEQYTLRDRHGVSVPFTLRRHRRLDRDFPKFGPRLAAKGQFHSGSIEGVAWSLVKVSALLGEVFAALIATSAGTLAEGATDCESR